MALIFDQQHFRFGNDDGTADPATWKGALDTDVSGGVDVNVRLRLVVSETTANPDLAPPSAFQLQYSKNGGTWTNVTGSSSNVRAHTTTRFADGAAVTRQLPQFGSNSFASAGADEADGLSPGNAMGSAVDGEAEFCFQVRGADVTGGDTIDLRVIADTTPLDAYSEIPRYTVSTGLSSLVNETITLSDGITKEIAKTLAELLSFSDFVGRLVERTVTETLSLSDAIEIGFPAGFVVETLVIADAVTKTVARSIVEQIVVGEGFDYTLARVIVESLSLSDTVTKRLAKTLSDSISLSDAVTKLARKIVKEPVSITDARIAFVQKVLTDTLSIIESVRANPAKVVGEPIGFSEAFAKTLGRLVAENLSLTETIAKVAHKPVSEVLGLVDHISKHPSKKITETIVFAESIASLRILFAVVVESIAVSDSITKAVAKRPIVETVAIADQVGKTFAKALTEAIGFLDSVSSLRTLIRLVAESLAISETITKAAAHRIAESIAIQDAISKGFEKTIAERIDLTDATKKMLIKLVSESLSVADTANKHLIKTLSEYLGFSDSIDSDIEAVITSLVDVAEYATPDEIEEIAGLLLEINEQASSDEG